ncbi:MAG TPA: hypothetical protein VF630_13385 [Hymenobacter sp.]|jgi:hypothetical protein
MRARAVTVIYRTKPRTYYAAPPWGRILALLEQGELMMKMHNQLILSGRSCYTRRPTNLSAELSRKLSQEWFIKPINSVMSSDDIIADAVLAEQHIMDALLMPRLRPRPLHEDIV